MATAAARMTTTTKRKKKTRKKAAKRAAKRKKAVVKTRATKSARRKAARPARAPKAQARKSRPSKSRPKKTPARTTRRPLAPAGRRLKSVARRAHPRVVARRRAVKPLAGAAPRVTGVTIKGKLGPRYREILSPPALRFLGDLHREFESTRERLLAARAEQQERYDAGELPDFRSDTAEVRDDPTWRVNTIPPDLEDRRVEITGPVDRKMIINALNCGANVYMADFEDANSPTWSNNIEGQINLKDRWAGKLDFTDPETRGPTRSPASRLC